MPICSRNMSMCCAALSAWGIVQLAGMGFLFYNHAVAFAEDLDLEVENDAEKVNMDAFYKMADQKYTYTVSPLFKSSSLQLQTMETNRIPLKYTGNQANNCWAAAAVYVLLFLFSLQQYFSNK
jgi:hypothetical protein